MPIEGHAVGQKRAVNQQVLEQTITENPELSRADLETQLGRKLTLKERLLVKAANKKAKKAARTGKLQVVALILCIILGLIGIHRFYLGYTGLGVLYVFTLGLFGIGWLIDLILLIIPDGLTPKNTHTYGDNGF